MNLYFLRHGIAQNFDPGEHSSDADRSLTREGKDKMEKEAKGIKKFGLQFDLILSSPYLRAKQTAEIVRENIEGPKIEISENLTPSSSTTKLMKELDSKYSKYSDILLSSHEPFLSESISRLLAESPHVAIHMKKGSLCKVKFDGKSARLSWLMTANQLCTMA